MFVPSVIMELEKHVKQKTLTSSFRIGLIRLSLLDGGGHQWHIREKEQSLRTILWLAMRDLHIICIELSFESTVL